MATEDRPIDALRDHLATIAAAGGTVTYEQLRAELGLEGDLVPVLRALSEAEDDAGRGLLTAVVVRADTGRPGAGWFRLAGTVNCVPGAGARSGTICTGNSPTAASGTRAVAPQREETFTRT